MKVKSSKKVADALVRINKALQYGDDMASSSVVCLWDAISLLESAIKEEVAEVPPQPLTQREEFEEACLRG